MILPEDISATQFKYHIIVIAIYVVVCIYFFFFRDSPASYFTFQKKDFALFFPIAICALFTLFIFHKIFHFGTIGINPENPLKILLTMGYAIIFALPEEIIFRGIIAKNLETHFKSILIAVILSALIFAAAHLLNGATSLAPSGWDWSFAGMTFIAGLFLAYAYFATDSLVLPILLHALFIIVNQVFILKA